MFLLGLFSMKTDAAYVIQFPISVQSSGRRRGRSMYSNYSVHWPGLQETVVLVNYTSVGETR